MSDPVEILEIDAQDEALLRAWWEVGADASRGRPPGSWPAWAVSRVALPHPDRERTTRFFCAYAAGSALGAGWLALPLKDNTHVAVMDVFVRVEHQRLGIGTALAETMEQAASEAGRTTVLSECFTIPDHDHDLGTVSFATGRGFVEANTEQIKELDLAEFDVRFDGLAATASARVGDYRILDYVGLPSAAQIAGYCDLLSSFMAQIPLGDLDLSDSPWTPERLRTMARRDESVGLVTYGSLAVAPDGAVIGCSDLNVRSADPGRATIGITVVSAHHRGHRLGLGLKLANHRAVRTLEPRCERVQTSNAGVNDHMNAINQMMGYRVVESLHEMQKRIE